MRVLQVLEKLNINSGITTIILDYYRHTDHSDYIIDFLVPSNEIQDTLRKEIEKNGGTIYEFVYPSITKLPLYKKSLKRFFDEKGSQYDIVQCSFFQIFREVFKFSKEAGIPVRIAHSHSARLSDNRLKEVRNKLLMCGALKNSTDYFAVSQEAAVGLFGHSRAQNAYITKDAIETSKYKFDNAIRTKMRRELDVEHKYVICHVGGLNPIKNQIFILQIITCLKKYGIEPTLLLVGKGVMRKTLEDNVKELELDENVVFLGERLDVNEILQAADVFVFPSLHEGFGLALLEAQCAGLPCFCSENIPPEAIASKTCRQMMIQDGPEAWAKAIIKYKEYEYTRESGYVDVLNKGYDILNACDEICCLYSKLLKEKKHV